MKIKTDTINLGAKGRYSLKVLDKNGEEVTEKRVEDTKNVVTYDGAYRMLFSQDLFDDFRARVGTGVTEINRDSTSLGNPDSNQSVGVDAARSGEIDNGDGTSTIVTERVMTFSLGAIVGTFSEVGVYHESSGAFIAGQLIKDEFGTPTTITVLADEQLIVTYLIEVTFPNGEVSVSPTIGSGSVTTPEGTSSYTIYGQPFFNQYSIGSSDDGVVANPGQYVFALDSSGVNQEVFDSAVSTTSSLGISGEVTLTHSLIQEPPSGLVYSSISYILIGAAYGGTVSSINAIDPVKKLRNNRADSLSPVLLEFSPALNKTDDRTLELQVEVKYQV